MDDFGHLSGCFINWEKTGVICVNIDETPQYVIHIPRVKGEQSLTHLGMPMLEGEDNMAVGRQVCIKFVKKARALQVLNLSIPARVVAINHILTATLWFYIFAWAPSEEEYKDFQKLILNFCGGNLWTKQRGVTK